MHFPSYVIGELLCVIAGYLRETYVSKSYERELAKSREQRAHERERANAWRGAAEKLGKSQTCKGGARTCKGGAR